MATFVSDRGLWHAAKEHIGGLVYQGKESINKEDLPKSIVISGEVLNPGDPFIYNGLDREALKMLNKEGYDLKGVQVIGNDFRHLPEFLQAVRTMGFNSVDEYLAHLGYDEKKDEAEFKSKAGRVSAHEVTKSVDAINILAGGRNQGDPSGESNIIGGFGEERVRPAKEAKKLQRI